MYLGDKITSCLYIYIYIIYIYMGINTKGIQLTMGAGNLKEAPGVQMVPSNFHFQPCYNLLQVITSSLHSTVSGFFL